ncbi:unnamed protein product, partial [Polarella glacialis]
VVGGRISVRGQCFSYPAAVITGSDQKAAYEAAAAPLVAGVQQGINCTLLAYGQTGSGKTHTMFGPTGCLTEASLAGQADAVPENWGVFPRAIAELLATPGLSSLHASAVEVYMENAYDLLSNRAQLRIGNCRPTQSAVLDGPDVSSGHFQGKVHPSSCTCRDCFQKRELEKEAQAARRSESVSASAAKQIGASKVEEEHVTVGEKVFPIESLADVARLARLVEAERVAHGHAMNARSSRSHCLVRVHATRTEAGCAVKQQLLFVDLAGSERIAKSEVEGTRRVEAVNINKSLTALAKVVQGLQLGASHVPFRDSSLTMLLRASFTGRSRIAVTVCVAADPEHAEETICSLSFGVRVAQVRDVAVREDRVVDLAVEKRSICIALEAARAELSHMESAGLGGSFAEGANPSEVKSLQDNLRRFQEFKLELVELKMALREVQAKRGAIEAVETKMRYAKSQMDNLHDIVLRQKSIAGLWKPPTSSFERKRGEVNELEARLALLG